MLLVRLGSFQAHGQTVGANDEEKAISALDADLDDALIKHESNIEQLGKLIEESLKQKGVEDLRQKALDSARFIYHSFNDFNMSYMQMVLKSGTKSSEEERRKFVYDLSVKKGIEEYFDIIEDFFSKRRKEIRQTIILPKI